MSTPQVSQKDLQELVEETRGLQPWRRLFHAANGLLVVGVILFSPLGVPQVIWILGGVLCLLLLLDLVRLARPRLNRLFFRIFLSLASPREERRPASSTWYVLGVLLTLLLFPRASALAGITVLALADPAASVLGQKFGTRRLGKGTVQGSSAFFLVAFLSLLPFAPWPAALGTAILVAAVEVIPWPLDDNLVLPLATGAILTALL